MGEAIEMLERIRSGFSLEAEFGADLQAEAVVDRFAEVIAPHATDDFECLMDGGMMTTRYEGIEGLRAGWSDFLGGFETLAISPGEVQEGANGDSVVEFVRLAGKPKGVAVAIEEDAAAVWRLRDGMLAAVEFHMDRGKALAAGGLEP